MSQRYIYVAMRDEWSIRKVPVTESNEQSAIWQADQYGTNIFWSLEEAILFMRDLAKENAESHKQFMLYWQGRFEEVDRIPVREGLL